MWISRSAPVEDEPEVFLELWSIRKTSTGDLHFVGFNVDHRAGRVSTKIVEFDAQLREGITESGRRYHLVGPAGYDPDAEYVWSRVARGRGISEWTDVTAELIPDCQRKYDL